MKFLETLRPKDAGQAAGIALYDYVWNRSVALLLRSKHGRLDIASGTCVQFGEHRMVATAAHNLEGLSPGDIEVLPGGRRLDKAAPIRRFGSSGTHTDDVAWLELDINRFDPLSLSFTAPTQISGLKHEDKVCPCLVQGYPAASVIPPANYLDRPLVESDGLLTLTIPPVRRKATHQPMIDIALEFPPHDGSLADQGLPPPPGISGGGVWLVPRFDDHTVWSSELAKLIGIGRGWWRESKEFVATRIEVWLQLVAADFPDVRSQIEEVLQSVSD